jgi:hypothetical protein
MTVDTICDYLNLFDTPSDQTQAMSQEQSKMFLGCLMSENEKGPMILPATRMLEQFEDAPFTMQVMLRRIAWAAPELSVSKWSLLFLGYLCDTPGKAVMWAHAIVQKTRQVGAAITVNDLATEYFPMGFPTEEFLHRNWDNQKGPRGSTVDNWLDTESAWK